MKKISLLATLAIPFIASTPAMAADDGFYLGASVGTARGSFDTGSLLAGAPAGTTLANDTSTTGWKVFGGYQINKYLGAEVNYVDLGKYNFSGTVPPVAFSGNVKVDGWGVAAVGTLPLDKGFSLLGKIGAVYSRESLSAVATFLGRSAAASTSDNKWVPQFGIGAKYAFNPNISVRIEAERYQGMGSTTNTVKTDVNLFTLGLAYNF